MARDFTFFLLFSSSHSYLSIFPFSVEGSMSSDLEKTGTFTAALRNMFGNGEKLTASWSLSDSSSALYSASYIKPRAFDTRKTLTVTGFKEKHDFSDRSSVKCQSSGVRVGVRDLEGR
jgi:outer membrane protein assembly factor BamA